MRTDGRTDETKLIVDFLNFEEAPKDVGVNLILSSQHVVSPQDILTARYNFLSTGPFILYGTSNAGWLQE